MEPTVPRKRIFVVYAALALSLISTRANAGGDACSELLRGGVFDVNNNSSEQTKATAFMHWFCDKEFRSETDFDNFAGSAEIPIEEVPVKLGFNSSEQEWSTWYKEVCSLTVLDSTFNSHVVSALRTVNQSLVDAFVRCQQTAGLHVWLERVPDPFSFFIAAKFTPSGPQGSVKMTEIDPGPNVFCETDLPRRNDPATAISVTASTYRVRCHRLDPGGVAVLMLAESEPIGGGSLSLPRVFEYSTGILTNASNSGSGVGNPANDDKGSVVFGVDRLQYSADGAGLMSRLYLDVSADRGAASRTQSATNIIHRVRFSGVASGGYKLTVGTSRVGAINRRNDNGSGVGSATLTAVTGTTNVPLVFGTTLQLPDWPDLPSGGTNQNIEIAQSSQGVICGRSDGVTKEFDLSFAQTATVTSAINEVAIRLGAPPPVNGTMVPASTVTLCDVCGYPGLPIRDGSTDGHFVNVALESFCGNGVTDTADTLPTGCSSAAEQCDDGPLNGTRVSCCNMNCTRKAAGVPCGLPSATVTPVATSPTPTPSTITQAPTQTVTTTPTRVDATPTASPSPTTIPSVGCVGDCNGNGIVSVNELIALVNLALGRGGSCPQGVSDQVPVSVSLLVTAVNRALTGCPIP